MHERFKVNLDFSPETIEKYYPIGLKYYNRFEKDFEDSFDDFRIEDGSLDGTKIQSKWFPQIHANIFISHSHNDEKLAITLAGVLKEHLQLRSFIDSCMWGFADKLLRKIDDEYSRIENVDNITKYDSIKRNYSTSNVYIMLSTAISKMIDKTECFFFLLTPNSINSNFTINSTQSPWIYFEILMAKLLRFKSISESRGRTVLFSKKAYIEEKLSMTYKVDLGHLREFGSKQLNDWIKEYDKIINSENLDIEHPLNILYKIDRLDIIKNIRKFYPF